MAVGKAGTGPPKRFATVHVVRALYGKNAVRADMGVQLVACSDENGSLCLRTLSTWCRVLVSSYGMAATAQTSPVVVALCIACSRPDTNSKRACGFLRHSQLTGSSRPRQEIYDDGI